MPTVRLAWCAVSALESPRFHQGITSLLSRMFSISNSSAESWGWGQTRSWCRVAGAGLRRLRGNWIDSRPRPRPNPHRQSSCSPSHVPAGPSPGSLQARVEFRKHRCLVQDGVHGGVAAAH